jgi:hypothetical protein
MLVMNYLGRSNSKDTSPLKDRFNQQIIECLLSSTFNHLIHRASKQSVDYS